MDPRTTVRNHSQANLRGTLWIAPRPTQRVSDNDAARPLKRSFRRGSGARSSGKSRTFSTLH